MQPVQVCNLSCKPFEETFENSQRRKVNNLNKVVWPLLGLVLEKTFEKHRNKATFMIKNTTIATLIFGDQLNLSVNKCMHEFR